MSGSGETDGPPSDETNLDEWHNAESTPPADEAIRWRFICLGELFLPSHIEGLLSGIEGLGWRGGAGVWQHDIYGWVKAARDFGVSGGQHFAPHLVREARGPGAQTVPLPEGVRFALASVWTVTPSITALTMQFVFDDEQSLVLDRALRKPRRTYTSPSSDGWKSIHEPSAQKQEDTLAQAAAIRACCERWMAERFPGAFAAGLLEGRVPSVDFVTARTFVPFGAGAVGGSFNYIQVLDLDASIDTYELRFEPMLRLGFPWRPHQPRHVMTVGASEKQLEDDEGRGGELATGLMRRVGDVALAWTLQNGLQGYQAALAARRDAAVAAGGESDPDALLAELHRLRAGFLPQWRDAQVFAEELGALSAEPYAAPYYDLDVWVADHPSPDREPLGRAMRRRASYHGKLLAQTEDQVRAQAAIDAEIAAASANVRLQRRIERLTYISITIAVVALCVAVLQTVCS